jgi:hypothetical protein
MGDRLEILLLTASGKSNSTFPAFVTGDMEQIMLGIPLVCKDDELSENPLIFAHAHAHERERGCFETYECERAPPVS